MRGFATVWFAPRLASRCGEIQVSAAGNSRYPIEECQEFMAFELRVVSRTHSSLANVFFVVFRVEELIRGGRQTHETKYIVRLNFS